MKDEGGSNKQIAPGLRLYERTKLRGGKVLVVLLVCKRNDQFPATTRQTASNASSPDSR
jgi:hypothetical protein